MFYKAFKHVLHLIDQLQDRFSPLFSEHIHVSGYRRGYIWQSVLTDFVETFKQNLDDNNMYVAYADPSKAFDCLPHGLGISKLAAYNACNVHHDSCSLLINYFNTCSNDGKELRSVML